MTETLTVLSLSKIGENLPGKETFSACPPPKKINKRSNTRPKKPSNKYPNMSDKKREKFKTLAENRVNTILKNLRLIGNLSNKSNYEYSESDLTKINAAIMREFRAMKERYQSGGKKENDKFKL